MKHVDKGCLSDLDQGPIVHETIKGLHQDRSTCGNESFHNPFNTIFEKISHVGPLKAHLLMLKQSESFNSRRSWKAYGIGIAELIFPEKVLHINSIIKEYFPEQNVFGESHVLPVPTDLPLGAEVAPFVCQVKKLKDHLPLFKGTAEEKQAASATLVQCGKRKDTTRFSSQTKWYANVCEGIGIPAPLKKTNDREIEFFQKLRGKYSSLHEFSMDWSIYTLLYDWLTPKLPQFLECKNEDKSIRDIHIRSATPTVKELLRNLKKTLLSKRETVWSPIVYDPIKNINAMKIVAESINIKKLPLITENEKKMPVAAIAPLKKQKTKASNTCHDASIPLTVPVEKTELFIKVALEPSALKLGLS
uniref:Uncharacterized protein n=1 Tax=Aplanochytrium stocchinoi TaxID=215587 RepID=A0A7S3PFW3_9STRA